MKPPRFRQSIAKVLLADCPELARLELMRELERKPSGAMDEGSLLDYLVFGLNDRYEVVDARYKSGPRQGEPVTDWTSKDAQEQRRAIRERGLLPVLDCEYDALLPAAQAIKARILELADEMAGGHPRSILYQPKLEWTSSLGVECEGTPDVAIAVHLRDVTKLCTIDVKHSAALRPAKMQRQVFDMGWDVQAAAYAEGVVFCEEHMGDGGRAAFHMDHVILATSSLELKMRPIARRLSDAYMQIGRNRWAKAQAKWKMCLESGDWPGYSEDPIEPSHYLVRTEIELNDTPTETFDEGDLDP